MAERTVDFAALGRVSSRAELKTIRLGEVSAKCEPKVVGVLEASLDNKCEVVGRENGLLRVACNYQFSVQITQTPVAEASVKYLLEYELRGDEPLADEDISEFAFANGTLHSWPFLREFLYSLTARMGYPPYTLPVFHFVPKPRQKPPSPEQPAPEPEQRAESPKEDS